MDDALVPEDREHPERGVQGGEFPGDILDAPVSLVDEVAGQGDQVGRSYLDIDTTPAATHIDRLEQFARLVDDGRQLFREKLLQPRLRDAKIAFHRSF